MNNQQFYDNVCNSIRSYGNQYGSSYTRGWSWVNPNNSSERCAIAKFIQGNDSIEVLNNLKIMLNIDHVSESKLVSETVIAFDFCPQSLNDPVECEIVLQRIADRSNVKYKQQVINTKFTTKDLVNCEL